MEMIGLEAIAEVGAEAKGVEEEVDAVEGAIGDHLDSLLTCCKTRLKASKSAFCHEVRQAD